MIVVKGNQAIPVSILKNGDMIVTASGDRSMVTSIKYVRRKGAYAPFTAPGKIGVNDIVVSNYISYQGSEYLKIGGLETPFSYQFLAHMFESAHRLAVMIDWFQG
jgi:hypothetical protein